MVANETFPFEMSVMAVFKDFFASKYFLMRRFEMKRDGCLQRREREGEQDMSRRLIYHCRDDIKLNTQKRTTGIQHVQNVIIILYYYFFSDPIETEK